MEIYRCCIFSYRMIIIVTDGIRRNFFSLVRNFTSILSFDHHNNAMTAIRASINTPIMWMRKPRHRQHSMETQGEEGLILTVEIGSSFMVTMAVGASLEK